MIWPDLALGIIASVAVIGWAWTELGRRNAIHYAARYRAKLIAGKRAASARGRHARSIQLQRQREKVAATTAKLVEGR